MIPRMTAEQAAAHQAKRAKPDPVIRAMLNEVRDIATLLPKPRIRQKRGGDGMNKTERRFADAHPGCRRDAPSFLLANGLSYRPDFWSETTILGNHGKVWSVMLFYEIKPSCSLRYSSRDSIPRLKMAARVWPMFRWFLATEKKGGGWDILEILP